MYERFNFWLPGSWLSLDINMGGKCKVTLSPILTEEFKRKVRKTLLPSKRILNECSNSSQLSICGHSHACACAHTHSHTHTKSQYIKQHTFILAFSSLFIFPFHSLFPYHYWLLSFFKDLVMYFPTNRVLSSAQSPVFPRLSRSCSTYLRKLRNLKVYLHI